MSVFRIEKNKDYTVMSNHHLKNKALTLKAKGLLSQMLSLPENWDYTLAGLSHINQEKIDAIRSAVHELENAGYITRTRERKENGKLGGAVYIIQEQPSGDEPISPVSDEPMLDNSTQVNPTLGNTTQLNKDISNKEKSITDLSIIHQSIQPEYKRGEDHNDAIDRINGKTAREVYRKVLKQNIGFESLCLNYKPLLYS